MHPISELQTVLLTRDRALSDLCTAELTALGFPPPLTVDAESAVPPAVSLLLVDLDGFRESVPVAADRAVGISRREESLPEALTRSFQTVLHRPFSIRDLRAVLPPPAAPRVSVRPRRRFTARGPVPRGDRAPVSEALRMNETATAVLVGTVEIPLTKREATVFLTLSRAAGTPVSREALALRLGASPDSNLPDVHVCAIRKKLAPYGKDVCIHTVRGKGYVLYTP